MIVLLLSACSPATPAPTVAPTLAPTTAVPATVAQPTIPPTTAPATAAATAAPADTAQPNPTPTVAPTTAPTPATLSGEVSFLTFGSPAHAQAFQALATVFEAKYPGAKVNVISLADNEVDYHAKLSTELAGGQPPEVVLLDYDAAAQYYASGALQSLSANVALSSVIHVADFYSQAFNAYHWQGQQMCLPISISTAKGLT